MKRDAFDKREIEINEWIPAEQFQLYMSKIANAPQNVSSGQMTYYFNTHEVTLPLHIRTPEKGDRIQLFGMKDAKRVSRIFIDEKIPSSARSHWPLLVDANENILAVIGVRISDKLSKVRRPIDDYLLSIK